MAGRKIALADGNQIPQIGFGVAGIRAPGLTATMVAAAMETGYAMIDNASIYGNEAEVGQALAASSVVRGNVFLTSKVWPDMYGFDNVISSFERSAGRLGVETLDLFLLHWPAPELDLYVESWRALIELRDQGRVRSIGVSNFYPEQLERLIGETGIVPVLNQVECHPYYQRREERAFHQAHDIASQCWSPLGRSTCLEDPVIVAIAQKHRCSAAQIVLAWALVQGRIVIPRSRDIGRMKENFDLDDTVLEPGEIAQIDGLDKGLEGRLGPDADFSK